MGIAVPDLEQPILKNTNAILAFAEEEAAPHPFSPCIRCGRCVAACPMNLTPCEVENAFDRKDLALLASLKINICMECGCCAYVCPAKRNDEWISDHNAIIATIMLPTPPQEERHWLPVPVPATVFLVWVPTVSNWLVSSRRRSRWEKRQALW